MAPPATVVNRRFEVRRAAPHEVVDLRWRILRAGLPRQDAVFPGDELPTSLHYAAAETGADPEPRIVCCATLHLEPWAGEQAYRLRGMATEAGYRGRGLGRSVLELAGADVRRDTQIRLLWCNARTPASDFYRRQGWEVRSGVFDIPTAGAHVRMTKRLT